MEKCKICGQEMQLRPAGISKKPPFNPYEAFMSCPNYKKHPPTKPDEFGVIPKQGDGNGILMHRLDAMGKYIQEEVVEKLDRLLKLAEG